MFFPLFFTAPQLGNQWVPATAPSLSIVQEPLTMSHIGEMVRKLSLNLFSALTATLCKSGKMAEEVA